MGERYMYSTIFIDKDGTRHITSIRALEETHVWNSRLYWYIGTQEGDRVYKEVAECES